MSNVPDRRTPVAVLGATGAVGQTFIRLLGDHPWFRLAELAASERSAGKAYVDAARWVGSLAMPESVRDMVVRTCEPSEIMSPLVFSALDASVAGDVETAFARAGRMVLSNAKNFRMEADVPLVIPEVNADHLALLGVQRATRGWKGGIVTNANCASIVAVMPLAPLHEAFGIKRLFIATMQAVSGAGYPGVPSLDILGNVIPYIKDEEAKIETEIQKMLGRLAWSAMWVCTSIARRCIRKNWISRSPARTDRAATTRRTKKGASTTRSSTSAGRRIATWASTCA